MVASADNELASRRLTLRAAALRASILKSGALSDRATGIQANPSWQNECERVADGHTNRSYASAGVRGTLVRRPPVDAARRQEGNFRRHSRLAGGWQGARGSAAVAGDECGPHRLADERAERVLGDKIAAEIHSGHQKEYKRRRNESEF